MTGFGIQNLEDLSRELTENGKLSLHFNSKTLTKNLTHWYQKNSRELPWRSDFKKFKSPYHVWVSEIMLQQTVIAAVIPKYKSFVKQFPDVKSLSKASEQDLQKATAGLGYYRRFKMMHEAAQMIDKATKFPANFKDLKNLRGVGEYTASAISSICFSEPQAVVDGNVERLLCRVFDIRLPPNHPQLKKVFKKTLDDIICQTSPGDFNQGAMEIGQLICTPNSPSCEICPLAKFCLSKKRSTQAIAPAKKIKKEFRNLTTLVHIYLRNDEVFLQKRDETSPFLKGIEGFPIQIGQNTTKNDFDSFSHTITNNKLINEVVLKRVLKRPLKCNLEGNGRWVPIKNIETELKTSFDRKAFKTIESLIMS